MAIKLAIICIIGGPGSGKTSMSSRIVERFGFESLNTELLIYQEIASESQKGQMFDILLKQGKSVSDNDIISIYKKSIFIKSESVNGFVLDGFPATKQHFELFEHFITPLDLAICLECSDDVLIRRCSERATNSAASFQEETFHLQNDSFKTELQNLGPLLRPKKLMVDAELPEDDMYRVVEAAIDNLVKQKALSLESEKRKSINGSFSYECRHSK